MNVIIYSRKEVEKLLKDDFPSNTVVISFYDPKTDYLIDDYLPVDYSKKCNMVFQVALDDLDIDYLSEKRIYL